MVAQDPCHKTLAAGVTAYSRSRQGGIAITTAEFEAWYQRFYAPVYRRLYYLLGDWAAAEDLTQEVFLQLHRRPPRQRDNPGGWLLQVATNLAYNHLRGEGRRHRREEGLGREEPVAIPLEEIVIRDEEARRVHQCLAQLPPRDRICLLLKDAGHSYAEIAAAIQVDKNSVGTTLARARQHFASLYSTLDGRGDRVSKSGRSSGLP